MHPDTFRHVHHARTADLQREATADRRASAAPHTDLPTRDVRAQVGWALVELGLRLVRTSGDTRFRTADVS
ncbi:hypothetical protein GCM10010329_35810 [Streptomyces spiroverticillatus]|uniref:Uncharacterized protein n=1 Tax=Streptomyces finlayi TaxID=67296 RepID=A0A918WYI5_9ACTN|nr:hypothetical protein [Streptomyces finlayi]GHA09970.1 hypothetical protein GCM10010329_35810 [Streptomyces spiroverticillatus]GHC95902.1 hypothetical protein GCM10010334_35800 [Streptomyces finlayi]